MTKPRHTTITIAARKLAAIQDHTRVLIELGFVRLGYIELAMLADTVGPSTLYIQKLRLPTP